MDKATGTAAALALEDLEGIGQRTTARKADRSRLKGWAFYQLQQFVAYKARSAGVPVLFVDPRNTSRQCSGCGHTERGNRRSRDAFVCQACNLALPADLNAAINIRNRALVMARKVGPDDAGSEARSRGLTSPLL